MPFSKCQRKDPQRKYAKFSKTIPSLSYTSFADPEKLKQSETDIAYKALLKDLKDKGSRKMLRRSAAVAEANYRVCIHPVKSYFLIFLIDAY